MLIFISDIHLNPEKPDRTGRFFTFIDVLQSIHSPEVLAETDVYIVGDLFDFWLETHSQIQDYYHAELNALRRLARSVRSVRILFGNRDFAYENHLSEWIGEKLRILGDQADIIEDGVRFHLEHGDLLCSRDEGYQRFRNRIRSRPVRFLFRLLPWFGVRKLVSALRSGSEKHKAETTAEAMDIDPDTARSVFEESGSDVIISGHVHTLRIREIETGNGTETKPVVSLGNWFSRIEYAEWKAPTLKLSAWEDDGTQSVSETREF